MSAVAPGAQRRLLRELADGGVDFVLVGGHAVAAHGYERATRDVDVVFSTGSESCARMASVLGELGATAELADEPPASEGISGPWLERGGHFRFATDAGPLDALSAIAGLDYEAMAARAIAVDLGGSEVRVCSYEDLVTMKTSGGRPRDLEDVRGLEQARGDE